MRSYFAAFALATTAMLGISAANAVPITVYSNNFDGVVTGTGVLSGAANSIESHQSLPAPFSGNILRNASGGNPATFTTLTLTGLPAHTSIDVNFLLAFIDSWDGASAPDYFNVNLNGVNIFQASAANASGSGTYSGGTDLGPGCNAYGFNGSFCDRAFDVGPDPALTVANSTSNVTLDFFASGAGWQGGSDESWGIDNLLIVVNAVRVPPGTAVPEPASILLLGGGLLGLARFRRRSRAK